MAQTSIFNLESTGESCGLHQSDLRYIVAIRSGTVANGEQSSRAEIRVCRIALRVAVSALVKPVDSLLQACR